MSHCSKSVRHQLLYCIDRNAGHAGMQFLALINYFTIKVHEFELKNMNLTKKSTLYSYFGNKGNARF